MRHLGQQFFFAVFGSFGPQQIQILVIGHLQMTLGGIWDKVIFLQILAFLTPKMGIFDPRNMHFANFGHERPTYDFWGHMGQNGSLPPATL